MKKLPVGIAALEMIIKEGYLYVDKTKFVEQLVTRGAYYFLSRPRRFGKSLLVDTIKQAFLGNKNIFKGLYLENHWDWNKVYPVIHLDFTSTEIESREEIDRTIISILDRIANSYQLELVEDLIPERFKELIIKLKQKYNQNVVIFVDEYDKPILDNIADTELCISIRKGLRKLYSVIKGMGADLQFVFLTGVSKFNKAGLFSGLNNLEDISLNANYADICGYNQAEVELNFSKYLEHGKVDLAKLKRWYDGYNFLGTEDQKVYNPFDILLFCNNNYEYNCYWYETGTPSFLTNLLVKNNYYLASIESMLVSRNLIGTFEIDKIPVTALLFQSGYLTIGEVVREDENTTKYRLTYPNLEVRISLTNYLSQIGTAPEIAEASIHKLKSYLDDKNFDEIGELFTSHFASIPNNWYVKNNIGEYEGFYAGIVFSIFSALGYKTIPEDATNTGRMDLAIKMPDKVIIVEFKLSNRGDAVDALQQIKIRGYADKYRGLKLPIYLLGISFNPVSRNLADYKWERA